MAKSNRRTKNLPVDFPQGFLEGDKVLGSRINGLHLSMPPKKAKGKAGAKSKVSDGYYYLVFYYISRNRSLNAHNSLFLRCSPHSQDKGPDIPPEWQAKSVEELQVLVAELQSEREAARKRRNKAQVEHASLQSYYDVTKQQIQELEMKIEQIDLEIENAEEDNATELKVYKQKSNFIQYCHEKKIEATSEGDAQKLQSSNADQERRMSELEAAKAEMLSELNELERRQTDEIKNLQAQIDQELSDVKQQLDLDILRFHEDCDRQHAQLKDELESRRKAELDIVTSRKESHLTDLMQSHEKTCTEMREYFEGIEREQQIEIEELEAEIRKLKKAAVHHAATKERLEASNIDSGKELSVCLEQVRVKYQMILVITGH